MPRSVGYGGRDAVVAAVVVGPGEPDQRGETDRAGDGLGRDGLGVDEGGERVGETVGLRVRLGSKIGPKTRIEVVTEGVFARMILDDPALDGIAAVLFATQLSVIQSTVPPNLELTVITAAVVGGVSILGGIGSVVGSTLAAILLAAIGSSLIFLNVSPYWIRAVQGVLILATVLADLWRRRRQVGR